MAKFDISVNVCMGCSCHGGGVYEYGCGSVELTDEQVQQLVALMQKYKTTKVEKLHLSTLLPDVYNALADAYREVAYRNNALHWYDEAWECGEIDVDSLAQYCEQFGYCYEPEDSCDEIDDEEVDDDCDDEDDWQRADHLKDWLRYFLEDADLSVLHTVYLDYLGFDECVFDLEEDSYSIAIPKQIIAMANIGKGEK